METTLLGEKISTERDMVDDIQVERYKESIGKITHNLGCPNKQPKSVRVRCHPMHLGYNL